MYTIPVGQNPTGVVRATFPPDTCLEAQCATDYGVGEEEGDLRHMCRVW